MHSESHYSLVVGTPSLIGTIRAITYCSNVNSIHNISVHINDKRLELLVRTFVTYNAEGITSE